MKKTVEAEVEVEVDLDEFDDDEIAEYLRERGYMVLAPGCGEVDAEQAYLALRRGDLEPVREFILEAANRVA